jgi:DNA-directed RNA polymerase subunit N (RpoN/RPB10)
MTQLQEKLRNGELTLDSISKTYDIGVKRHPKYENLVMFKYGIFSPMTEQFVRECRGIILDEKNNWNIVNRTFDKFFNLHEGHAAQLDWETVRAFEKLDGSLCQLFFHDNEWHFASSGSPDAGGEAHGAGFTFNELMRQTFELNGYKYPPDEYITYSFAFELITKWNKIVVQYGDQQRLVLTGVRDNSTGKEYPIESFSHLGYELVKTFDLRTKEQVLEYVEKMNGIEGEGFVLCDANFNRVKVKAPHYVALHQLRGEYFNEKRALEIVMKGEIEEVVSYFPEFKKEIEEVKSKYDLLKEDIVGRYEANKMLVTQKDFAMAVKDFKFSSILFAMRKGKTLEECMKDARLESVLSWL